MQQIDSGPAKTQRAGQTFTPAELSEIAKELYGWAPFVGRQFARHRPRTSPFHLVIPQVPAGASVLDVGCGNGLLLGLLAKTGVLGSGVGFDYSAAAIQRAKRMADNLHGRGAEANLRFDLLDASKPWPAGLFDAVTIVDLLHHLPAASQKPVIESTTAKLSPGGRLIYKDMARRPRWRATMNRIHDLVIARQWIHYAPVEAVEGWALRSGLKLSHAESVDMLWYRHELRVFVRPQS
jgi:2-polyprenyl-3-methyl-5-hydroxy-6-metoxy-1,4-benzoquinol methylase